jgi:hypothetical protein
LSLFVYSLSITVFICILAAPILWLFQKSLSFRKVYWTTFKVLLVVAVGLVSIRLLALVTSPIPVRVEPIQVQQGQPIRYSPPVYQTDLPPAPTAPPELATPSNWNQEFVPNSNEAPVIQTIVIEMPTGLISSDESMATPPPNAPPPPTAPPPLETPSNWNQVP